MHGLPKSHLDWSVRFNVDRYGMWRRDHNCSRGHDSSRWYDRECRRNSHGRRDSRFFGRRCHRECRRNSHGGRNRRFFGGRCHRECRGRNSHGRHDSHLLGGRHNFKHWRWGCGRISSGRGRHVQRWWRSGGRILCWRPSWRYLCSVQSLPQQFGSHNSGLPLLWSHVPDRQLHV